MNLMQCIEEASVQHGGESRRAIAEFILTEHRRLHQYSIQEIAEKTYTSKAALVRFAKFLGFSGWKEFIRSFVEEQRYESAHYTDIDANMPFSARSSDGDIIQQLCSLQVESLLDTADQLDVHTLGRVVSLLQQSKRIAVFGTNPNSLLGELFGRRMFSIQRGVETASLGNVKMLADSLQKEDCAIIISYAGNSLNHDPVSVIPFLKNHRVPIVAITSGGSNYLRRNADYTLTISSHERLYSKISTFATETSILYILNVIFSCYFARNYEHNWEVKIQQGRQMESMRYGSLPDMQEPEQSSGSNDPFTK